VSPRTWRVGYADVIATMALFIALGGGAWALAKNSVDSRAIENGSVRSQELKDDDVRGTDIEANAVGGSELGDGSVGAAEVADGEITGADLAAGAVGSAEVADDSLGGADINEPALFNDDSLTGADLDESTLNGLQQGAGATEIAAAEGIALFDEVTAFEAAGASLIYTCAGSPILTYANRSGAEAIFFASLRGVIQDDDGVANNAQVLASSSTVADGADTSIGLSGPAGLGHAEVAVLQDNQLFSVMVFSRALAGGCDFISTLNRQPR
jgi:hypothetical protein